MTLTRGRLPLLVAAQAPPSIWPMSWGPPRCTGQWWGPARPRCCCWRRRGCGPGKGEVGARALEQMAALPAACESGWAAVAWHLGFTACSHSPARSAAPPWTSWQAFMRRRSTWRCAPAGPPACQPACLPTRVPTCRPACLLACQACAASAPPGASLRRQPTWWARCCQAEAHRPCSLAAQRPLLTAAHSGNLSMIRLLHQVGADAIWWPAPLPRPPWHIHVHACMHARRHVGKHVHKQPRPPPPHPPSSAGRQPGRTHPLRLYSAVGGRLLGAAGGGAPAAEPRGRPKPGRVRAGTLDALRAHARSAAALWRDARAALPLRYMQAHSLLHAGRAFLGPGHPGPPGACMGAAL